MNIGPYVLANNVFVAPMAGVTDRPFRVLCKTLGAGYAVSEMVTPMRDADGKWRVAGYYIRSAGRDAPEP